VKVVREALLTVAVAACLTGCGGSGDKPELGQVTGTITLDGEPLTGIAVVFFPESGRPARGKTDADGKYELTYIRQERGTKLGRNRVEIAPDEEGEDEREAEEASSGEGESRSRVVAKKGSKPKIPARYNTKSELEAVVKAGENVFDFQLATK